MSTPIGFFEVLLESKKIINDHSRHFLALSLLFLLPLSLLLIVFPTFQSTLTTTLRSQEELLRSPFPPNPNQIIKPFLLSILYSLSILPLHLCATGTITYSVFHSFYGRPVKLLAAFRSISSSLWRLLFTTLCYASLFFAFPTFYFLILFLVLGFRFPLPFLSPSLIAVSFIVLGSGFLYLQTNWTLASVVCVIEASWGVEPLRRSAYLVRGMRSLAFKLNLLFSVMFFLAFIISSLLTMIASFLFSIATNTLLFMYCKALHNELASDIVEEFACEYVSLPFDDQKAPHTVSVELQ